MICKRRELQPLKVKNYKLIFEKIKQKSQKNYYVKKLEQSQGNSKNTWKVIKEIIGKSKIEKNVLPKELNVNGENIKNQENIAQTLNNYFVNVGKSLSKTIQNSSKNVKSFLQNYENSMMQTMIAENQEISEDSIHKQFTAKGKTDVIAFEADDIVQTERSLTKLPPNSLGSVRKYGKSNARSKL